MEATGGREDTDECLDTVNTMVEGTADDSDEEFRLLDEKIATKVLIEKHKQ